MKVLNAFSGVGSNRYLWDELGDFEITAVEHNSHVASEYSKLYPGDRIVVADAWEFIEKHFLDYNIIWASPPCPTHSRFRKVNFGRTGKAYLPDLRLYSLVILLREFHDGNWVVENVKPYYKPLLPAIEISRHYFWSNVKLQNHIKLPDCKIAYNYKMTMTRYKEKMREYLGFPVPDVSVPDLDGRLRPDTVFRNCVHPKLGKYLLKQLINEPKTIMDFVS